MRTGLRDPDSLLEQLETVNDRLLSLSASDLLEISKTVELRAQLAARVGHLLRSSAHTSVLKAYREGLEQAVDAGDLAVQRLLSLRQTTSRGITDEPIA